VQAPFDIADRARAKADAAAGNRRATDAQVLEDAERLIPTWNERQAKRMPILFSPTIGAAIAACYWFLWVRCPAWRTINAVDLRTLDRHRDAAITSLISTLSCRSCRPNAHLPSSCDYLGPVLPTKCGGRIGVESSASRLRNFRACRADDPIAQKIKESLRGIY
jgi:hypothetical protein